MLSWVMVPGNFSSSIFQANSNRRTIISINIILLLALSVASIGALCIKTVETSEVFPENF